MFYNINKVEQGEAEIIAVRNFADDKFGTIYRTLLERDAMAIRTEKPSVHMVLSCDKGENLTDDQAVELIEKNLGDADIAEQPIVVFRHDDTKHKHFHVVSTKIREDGKSIVWNGIGKRLVNSLTKYQREYGYVAGQDLRKKKESESVKQQGLGRDTLKLFERICQTAVNVAEIRDTLKQGGIRMTEFTSKHTGETMIRLSRPHNRPVYVSSRQVVVMRETLAQNRRIAAEKKAKEAEAVSKLNDLIAGYKSILPPMFSPDRASLISVRNKAFQLMKAADEAKIAVSAETRSKLGELKNTWNEFSQLNQERRSIKRSPAEIIEPIGGMLTLLNPIIGLTVLFLASIGIDIRRAALSDQKKKLLVKVESLRDELKALEEAKAALTIEKKRLQEYLNAKRMYQEYMDGLHRVDNEIKRIHQDIENDERGVIHVTPQNYRDITLPDSYRVIEWQGRLLLNNIEMGPDGMYLVRENGQYISYSAKNYDIVYRRAHKKEVNSPLHNKTKKGPHL